MTPKEISRRASAIFRDALPSSWAIRDQQDQEDYGVDYEIETLTEQDKPSGILFKIQQKGQVSLERRENNVVIRGFETSKLRYFARIRVPVVLVAIDITDRLAYWTVVQGNPSIIDALTAADESGKATVSVSLPEGNQLSANPFKLLDDVVRTMEYITVQSIIELRSIRVAQIASRQMDLSHVSSQFRTHSDLLRSEELELLFHTNKQEQLQTIANQILDAESESPRLRCVAALQLIKLARTSSADSGTGDDTKCIRIRLEITSRLLRVARKNSDDKRIRRCARLEARLARLQKAVSEDYALYASSLMQTNTAGPFSDYAEMIVRFQRSLSTLDVLRQFNRIEHVMDRMVFGDDLDLIPQSWGSLAFEMGRFITRLIREHQNTGSLLDHIDSMGNLAIEFAIECKDWRSVYLCAMQQVMLGIADPNLLDKRLIRAETIASRLPESEPLRVEMAKDIASLRIEFSGKKTFSPTFDQETEFIASMARAMQIDLDNPDDEVAEVVRIGLRDRNPERVLRTCEHLYVSLRGGGLPAQLLGLPTAGFKNLFCTKFGFGCGALSLDRAFESFGAEHCDKCTELQEHPAQWKWTPEWQQHQDKLHGERFSSI